MAELAFAHNAAKTTDLCSEHMPKLCFFGRFMPPFMPNLNHYAQVMPQLCTVLAEIHLKLI